MCLFKTIIEHTGCMPLLRLVMSYYISSDVSTAEKQALRFRVPALRAMIEERDALRCNHETLTNLNEFECKKERLQHACEAICYAEAVREISKYDFRCYD